MLCQATLPGLHSAIFSPESVSGHMPCAKPDGRMIDPSGQEVVPASRLAAQGKGKGSQTSATSGLNFTASLASAALQSALENRLRQKTGLLGSSLYRLTWKVRATPSGRLIPALRASVRRISGNGCTGWPTPLAADSRGRAGAAAHKNSELPNAACLCTGWPTPTTSDENASRTSNPQEYSLRELSRPNSGTNLAIVAQAYACGWPTPTTQDDNCSRMPNPQEYAEKRLARANACSNLAQTAQAFAHNAPARLTAFGEILTGSCARMESAGS